MVGSNCGTGIEDMVEIARAMTRATRLPLLIQPNAGLPQSRDGQVVYDETPETMAARVPELLDLGVAIVGGCCGTTPDHIRAIRRAVDASHDPRAARVDLTWAEGAGRVAPSSLSPLLLPPCSAARPR